MKKCPRCGYERTDKDDGFISKEECPRCGIYYTKYVEVVKSSNGDDTFGATRKDTHEDEQLGEAQISLDNNTKKCPFCAEVIQSEAIKCKHCGEWLDKKDEPTLDKKDASTGNISTPTGSSSSQQNTVTTQPPKKQNVNESSKFLRDTYHPWRRYFARMVDYSTGGLLAIFVVGFIFGLLFPDKVEGLTKVTVFTKASNYLTIVIIADFVLKIIWMPIEAVLLSTVGNTPGKWLFGISVRTTSGQILSFSQALERSWGVLLKGMALGIPFVLLVTQYFAYKRLTNTGTTLWDAETDCVVSHINWSTARTMACVGTVIALIFMMGLLNTAFKDHSGKLANYGSKPDFVFTDDAPNAPAPPAPEAAPATAPPTYNSPVAQTSTELTPSNISSSKKELSEEEHFNFIKKAHPDFRYYRDAGTIKNWIQAKPEPQRSALTKIYNKGTAQEIIDMITLFKRENGIPSTYNSAGETRAVQTVENYKDKNISIDFQDADIRKVFSLMGQYVDINIVVSEEVNGTITMIMKNVTWRQAFDAILDKYGLSQTQVNDRTILITFK